MPTTTLNPFVITQSYEFNKKALKALNVAYILVGLTLVGVGSWAHASTHISSIGITGAVVASGVFVCAVSCMGYYGAHKHHVAVLFFYMIIMAVIVLMQFIVSCVTLSFGDAEDLKEMIQNGWVESSEGTKNDIQREFDCCGLFNVNDPPPLNRGSECPGTTFEQAVVCYPSLSSSLGSLLTATGAVALVFSFVQLFGIWAAHKFRKQKNPKANPEVFL